MGANIRQMLEQLSETTDEEVKKIHDKHDIASIKGLLSRFRHYEDGICLVHNMFGSEVAKSIGENYTDAFLTAHFEVPGEMFRLALHASHNGDRGVIGSTKNIWTSSSAKSRRQRATDSVTSSSSSSERSQA